MRALGRVGRFSIAPTLPLLISALPVLGDSGTGPASVAVGPLRMLAIALMLVAVGAAGGWILSRRITAPVLDELSQSRALLAAIVESSEDAIISKTLDGIVMSWNGGAERLFGYAASEAIGRPVTIIIPPDREDEERAILERLRRGERIENFETVRQTKDGRCIDISLTASLVRDTTGRIIGASKVARDIGARKRGEEELRRSNAELERFALVASHDLQEPLRMVGSYVQLLGKRYQGKLDAEADQFIDYARDAALRMQNLIDDLLAFSRVGMRDGALVRTDAHAALDRALANLRLSIEEAGAAVTSDRLPTLLADPRQLEHVFMNLVGNAVKFRGARRPEIHVSAARQDDGWLFSVRDNGIGIDPQYFDRIFVMLQRLHARDEFPGTGIGLAITKRIVEAHGGRIWVDSQPGRGSTFYFTIPGTRRPAGPA